MLEEEAYDGAAGVEGVQRRHIISIHDGTLFGAGSGKLPQRSVYCWINRLGHDHQQGIDPASLLVGEAILLYPLAAVLYQGGDLVGIETGENSHQRGKAFLDSVQLDYAIV